MRTLSLTDAREHMTVLADPIEQTMLTRKGEPVSVVMGIDAYRSMIAILEMARDPARYVATIGAHLKVQSGELEDTVSLDDFEAQLQQLEDSHMDEANGGVQILKG